MPIVSFSVDTNLLRRFEAIMKEEGYSTKSEAFRLALREFVSNRESQHLKDDVPTETILVFSYLDTPTLRDQLLEIQHKHMSKIKESLHRHLYGGLCFEVITLTGTRRELKPIITSLETLRGMDFFKVLAFELRPEG